MQQDTNETIGQLNAQELQAITGGCDQCDEVHRLAAQYKRTYGIQLNSKYRSDEEKQEIQRKMGQIDTLRDDAWESRLKEPQGRLGVCVNNSRLSSRLMDLKP